MNGVVIKLLVRWIVIVTTMICYQSNIFPHDQIRELDIVSDELLKELRDYQ